MDMDINIVYGSLQELFPQIDNRLLKVVAKEHSTDLNAAIDDVLSDILPYMSKMSNSPVTPPGNQGLLGRTDGGAVRGQQSMTLKLKEVVETNDVGPSSISDSILAADDIDHSSNVVDMCSSSLYEAALDKNDGHGPVCGDSETELMMSLGKGKDINVNAGPKLMSNGTLFTSMQASDAGGCSSTSELEGWEKFDWSLTNDLKIVTSLKIHDEESSLDSSPMEVEDSVARLVFSSDQENKIDKDWFHKEELSLDRIRSKVEESSLDSSPVEVGDSVAHPVLSSDEGNKIDKDCFHKEELSLDSTRSKVGGSVAHLVLSSDHEHTPCEGDYSFRSEIDAGGVVSDYEKPKTSCSVDLTITEDNSVREVLDIEDEPTLNPLVTRSGQICSSIFLEDIIEDAKSNKKILFSAMESVINMMREVELEEKFAEEAKEEAATAGLDIHSKSEELKKMLQSAKELNDMHAGEIYGEKSILATEARELQSRLLSLSDERDKSLAILDEMRQTLEARLAAAEEERKAAEQEKLEKEEAAQRALAEQKNIMAKVVQESDILQQEAEENSKLREFLVDRGRIVDMLQGEISVICQDVRLLKERFDERVPLSKSVSSSQTSCILASSSSSLKSVASVQVLEQCKSSGSSKQSTPAASIDGQSPKSSPLDKRSGADRKALLDDGWELFDNEGDTHLGDA